MRSIPTLAFLVGLMLATPISAGQETHLDDLYPQIDRIGALVLSCQLPCGGIALSPGDMSNPRIFMTTYSFGGLALAKAYQMTGKTLYADACRRFIEFWLARQLTPDRFDVSGTMYDLDYIKSTGELKNHIYDQSSPPNKGGPGYDAADADAPMIAITAYQYYLATGDIALLKRHAAQLDLIGQSVKAMLDTDGLTWAHPKYKMKYLMDAAEAQCGFISLSHIFQICGDRDRAGLYADLADRMRQGIASQWSPSKKWYFWTRQEDGGRQPCDWNQVYPDSMEEIWPAVWDEKVLQSPRTIIAWSNFVAHWPQWPRQENLLGWPQVGFVASRLGDAVGAQEQTRNILDKKFARADWEVNQMYFTLLNCCDCFDLSGNAHVMTGSVRRSPETFSVALYSNMGGQAILALRPITGQRVAFHLHPPARLLNPISVGGRTLQTLNFNPNQTLDVEVAFNAD